MKTGFPSSQSCFATTVAPLRPMWLWTRAHNSQSSRTPSEPSGIPPRRRSPPLGQSRWWSCRHVITAQTVHRNFRPRNRCSRGMGPRRRDPSSPRSPRCVRRLSLRLPPVGTQIDCDADAVACALPPGRPLIICRCCRRARRSSSSACVGRAWQSAAAERVLNRALRFFESPPSPGLALRRQRLDDFALGLAYTFLDATMAGE